jgi:hypothetical protein
MKYVLSASELMDRGLWLEFCELRGINEWAVNEGMMDSDEEFVFSEDEAATLGLIARKDS